MQQGSPEWKAMRKNFIMASDAPVIMGVSTYGKTLRDLWREKLGLMEEQGETLAMKYGKENEEVARSLYESITGNLMAPEVVFHPTIRFMGASLDGLSLDKDIAVEIKCTNAKNHELAKQKIVPPEFYPQLQHQMACLNHDKIHYLSFHKREVEIFAVERNNAYIEEMIEKERQFWEMVQNFEEPEKTDPDLIEGDKNWIQDAEKLWEIKKAKKVLLEQEKALENSLRESSQGKSTFGGNYIYKVSSLKGTVDYSIIPELKDVDLEKYRKPSTVKWTLSRNE